MKRPFLFIVVLGAIYGLFSGEKTPKQIVSVAQAITPAIFFTWSEIPVTRATSVSEKAIEFAGLDGKSFSLVTEAMASENNIKSRSDFDAFTEMLQGKISYCTSQTFKDIKKNRPKNVNEVTINRSIAKCLRNNGVTGNAYSYSEFIRVDDQRRKGL